MNKTLLFLWLACIVVAVSVFFFVLGGNPATLTTLMKNTTQENLWLAGFIYVFILSIRGMTFIPSTPLLFAGLTLFPSHFSYVANLIGILLSCCLVILSIQRVGINTELAKIDSPRYQKLADRIRRNGFYAIVLWSFFPFAPTDAIVYVSSSIGMARRKIIAGVMFGEAILMAIYVYGGSALLNRLLA